MTASPVIAEDGLSRRKFLFLLGSGSACVALAGLGGKPNALEEGASWPTRVESFRSTTCRLCSAGCGMRARTVDGKLVRVEGHPFHPLSRGGLCARGLAAPQVLYHPDRILSPLRRSGERGSGQFEPIAWDDALAMVADRLRRVRESSGPHTLAVMDGQVGSSASELLRRFAAAYGSPNYLLMNRNEPRELATYLTFGVRSVLGYDLAHADFLLSFGEGLLDQGISPVLAERLYGDLRQGQRNEQARVVQIEPRFSRSAARADEWVPIHPGTYAALALSIAYVIIKERYYDAEFVKAHTFGFEPWTDEEGKAHEGFRDVVLSSGRPEDAAEVTGISVDTIRRIAKAFASASAPVAVANAEVGWHRGGVHAVMAIHALNALLGRIDVPGGTVMPMPPPLAEVELPVPDEIAARGLSMPRIDGALSREFPLATSLTAAFPGRVVRREPYALDTLILHHVNPVFTEPSGLDYESALREIPFVVSISPVLDETSTFADLVLPACTFLETNDVVAHASPLGFPVVGLVQRVVPPLGDSRPAPETVLEIAKKIGGVTGAAFPWDSAVDYVSFRIGGLFRANRGTVWRDEMREEHVRLLEDRGWWLPSQETESEFVRELNERGGWWDPLYPLGEWGRVFASPTRRFEFYSRVLEHSLAAGDRASVRDALRAAGVRATGDEALMPHAERVPTSGAPSRYPLLLHVFPIAVVDGTGIASTPLLMSITDPSGRIPYDSWIEVNPETARVLEISDGTIVVIESPVGRMRARMRVLAGAMPGLANVSAGLGHSRCGRFARGIGQNPCVLLGTDIDQLSGVACRSGMRVRIEAV